MFNGTVGIIWGNVGFSGGDPTILSGSKDANGSYNFSINRADKGVFFVSFPQDFFNQVPVVIVTQIWNGGNTTTTVPADKPYLSGSALDNAALVGVSVTKCKLITGDENGNLTDRMFGFVAVGQCQATTTCQSATQMMWGTVGYNSNGPTALSSGTGDWTIDYDDAGRLDILFTENFTSIPTVLVTQIFNGTTVDANGNTVVTLDSIDPAVASNGGSPLDNAVVVAVNTEKFRVITGDEDGNQLDRMFNFLVVGPGSQTVAGSSLTVEFGNIGYDPTLMQISGSLGLGKALLQLNSNNTWSTPGSPPKGASVELGVYGFANANLELSAPTMVTTQIYAGANNSGDVSNFNYTDGVTLDNSVVVSVGSGDTTMYAIAGDANGKRQNRMIGVVIVDD
jgi:hypothetical protein